MFGALLGMVGGISQAIVKGSKTQTALGRLLAALGNLKPLDLTEMNRIATEGDVKHFQQSLDTQRKLDPTFAALRSNGAASLLAGLNDDAANSVGGSSVREIQGLLADSAAGDKSAIQTLMRKAQEELDAGATLPPEFQAELVKAGLEASGRGGFGIEGRGVGGVETRRLIGKEGLALEQLRQEEAKGNISAAEAIRQGRMSALSDVATLDNNLRTQRTNRAAVATGIGQNAVPSIGLTGSTLANAYVHNIEQENDITLGRGNIQAQKSLAKGEMWNSIIGSITGGLSGIAGSGGFGGSSFFGGGSGGGGGISSLLGGGSGGGGSSIPQVSALNGDLFRASGYNPSYSQIAQYNPSQYFYGGR